jgi:hypothetical protein
MHAELADMFTEICVDAVLCIRRPEEPLDLHMVCLRRTIGACNSTCSSVRLCEARRGMRERNTAWRGVDLPALVDLDLHPTPHRFPLRPPPPPTPLIFLPPFQIEIMHMQHKAGTDSRLVQGLVLDHGGRHPGMPKSLKKVRVLKRTRKHAHTHTLCCTCMRLWRPMG